MGIERRLHPRAIVRLAGELQEDATPEWQGVLVNDLSAGGASVHAAMPLAAGAEVKLRFRLPSTGSEDDTEIEVRALIVRWTKNTSPDASRPHLYGLHFLDLHDESFKAVERYVWDQLHDS